jgi:predicted nucleic acid-binding protein
MADYLLDANHLSPLVTLGNPLRDQLRQRIATGNRLAVATPALAEMLYGIQHLPRATLNLQEWQKYQNLFVYYDIDRDIAERSASLRIELRRRGRQLTAIDAMIAVIALRYGLILVTTDQDFVSIPGLHLENWRI